MSKRVGVGVSMGQSLEARKIGALRNRARADALALVKLCGGLNKAAKQIGMSKGRLSFIVRGQWQNVSVSEIDLVMLSTGRAILEHDIALTNEARELAGEFQKQLSDLHTTAAALLRVLRRL